MKVSKTSNYSKIIDPYWAKLTNKKSQWHIITEATEHRVVQRYFFSEIPRMKKTNLFTVHFISNLKVKVFSNKS